MLVELASETAALTASAAIWNVIVNGHLGLWLLVLLCGKSPASAHQNFPIYGTIYYSVKSLMWDYMLAPINRYVQSLLLL